MKNISKAYFYADIELIKFLLYEIGLEEYIDKLNIDKFEKYAENEHGNIRRVCCEQLYRILVIIRFVIDEQYRISGKIVSPIIQLASKIIDSFILRYLDITHLK